MDVSAATTAALAVAPAEMVGAGIAAAVETVTELTVVDEPDWTAGLGIVVAAVTVAGVAV
ncbi:hypothetical protein [Nonomuraea rubra]|uniref:hypothetical protein n=1 Tax=Nonomuraea rubra TaxID=46180 RepID=UPI0031ECCC93